jgi:hypothetical protein
MKLPRLVPNFYKHVFVSGFYIPRICLPIWLQQNRQTDPVNTLYLNRSQIPECGNWETELCKSVLEIMRSRSFISGNA